jgi:anti-sigma regulatory factor (Ser/Thr protein kinase)
MPKKAETSRLKVEASGRNLGLIRKFIGAGMKNTGFPRKKISALKVAVTEHCENLIRHAYAEKSGKVELKLNLKYPAAKITALDYGKKFDMIRYKIPDTHKRVRKGLGGKMGIKTILALCDAVLYKRNNGHNENTFIVLAKKSGKGKNKWQR